MIQSARLNVSNKGLVGVNHRATGHEYRNYIVPGSIPDGEERHPINYSIAPNSLAAVKRIESNMVNRAMSNPFYSYLSETRQDVIQSSLEESEETEPIDEGSGLLPDGRIPRNFTRKLIYAHDYVLPYMKQHHMPDYAKYSRLLNPRTIDKAIDFTRRDREGYLYSRGGNLFGNVFGVVGDVYSVANNLTGGIHNITHGISSAVDYGADKFKDLKKWWKDINIDPQEGFNDIKGKIVSDRNNLYDNWKISNDNEAKKKNKELADLYYPEAHFSNKDPVSEVLARRDYLNKITPTFHKDYIRYAADPTLVNKVVNTVTNTAKPVVNVAKKTANTLVDGANKIGSYIKDKFNSFSDYYFGKHPEEQQLLQDENPLEIDIGDVPSPSPIPHLNEDITPSPIFPLGDNNDDNILIPSPSPPVTLENIHNIDIDESRPIDLIPRMNDPTAPLPVTIPMSQVVKNNFSPNITPVAPIPGPVSNVTLENKNNKNKDDDDDDDFESCDDGEGNKFYIAGHGLRRKRRTTTPKKFRNKRRKH
ncbi:hypothetical protein WA158_006790 [Blastocystis sp. Blastoise]